MWSSPRNREKGTEGSYRVGAYGTPDLAGRYGLSAANVALVEGLTRWLAVLGYAAATVRRQRQGAARWCAWLQGLGVGSVTEARDSDVAEYADHLRTLGSARTGRGLTAGSVAGLLEAVGLVERYRSEALGETPVIRAWPEVEARAGGARRYLSRAEVAALYAACERDAGGWWDRCLLTLAYGCGLRAGEVAALRTGDVDLAGGVVRVWRSKTARGRYVPLSGGVARDLATWLGRGVDGEHDGAGGERARYAVARCDRVLVSRAGGPIGYGGLWRRLHALCDAAGVERCGLHALRHSIATHLLEGDHAGDGNGGRGMSLEAVGRFLGHRTLAATQVYTHVDAEGPPAP